MSAAKEAALDKLINALDGMRDYIEDQACICKEIDENPEDGWRCGAHEIYEALDNYRATLDSGAARKGGQT